MNTKIRTRREDLEHPELSYKILGVLFDVYQAVGPNRREVIYQRAVAVGLSAANIKFIEQAPVILMYKNKNVGRYYFDFLVENKIVLEIKARNYFSVKDMRQILEYLRQANLTLGVLAHFSDSGVKYKRIINRS